MILKQMMIDLLSNYIISIKNMSGDVRCTCKLTSLSIRFIRILTDTIL
jgi:hypothetical protein